MTPAQQAARWHVHVGGDEGTITTTAIAPTPEQAARAVFEYPIDVDHGTVKLAGTAVIIGRVEKPRP